MNSQLVCFYHSHKNCFAYVDSKYKRQNSYEVVVELVSNDDRTIFLSLLFIDNLENRNRISSMQSFYLNNLYAKQLAIKQEEEFLVKNWFTLWEYASSIQIRPVSEDDWEILELNLDFVQNELLNQIKVVFCNQVFPIWLESANCIYVKTVDFEPKVKNYVAINNMTRVLIEPLENQTNRSRESKDEKSMENLKNWESSFQVEFFDENESFNTALECTKLTTVQLGREVSSPIQSKCFDKYLVKLEALKSPMKTFKIKESISANMQKFIQTLENSYPDEYFSPVADESQSVYAFLSLLDLDYIAKLVSNPNENKLRLQMSNFLRKQTKLFELNPKIIIKASHLSEQEYDKLVSSKSEITLLTNCKENVQSVKTSFKKFIDEYTNCVCPILLTKGMTLELKLDRAQAIEEEKTVLCQIKLAANKEFVTISSNMFLHNLVDIKVELLENGKDLVEAKAPNVRLFDLNILECKWFKSNVDELMAHLREFFLNSSHNSSVLPRGLILHGYRGCGKSTLCKYVCNLVSREPFNAIYQYVNCKNFIGKSVDLIHEQLKLVYQECLWYENCPSLVVLENLDLLIEHKTESNDPNAMLYYSQIVEALKNLLTYCWDSSSSSRIVTLITTSCSIELMPSMFHSLDEHGLFTSFVRVKLHSDREETREIVELILKKKECKFDNELIEAVLKLSESFVFKDIEKLINKIIFNKWSQYWSALSLPQPSEPFETITLDNSENVLYSYTCINMFETKFYRSKSAISWDSVGGLNKIKKTLVESLIWPFKYRNLYTRLHMKQSGGVLLYGPSGCGKTLLASALANECKFNFLSVKGPELLNKYIGSSEQNVRDLFGKAEKAKPCIIFFDEFDSLAPKRGHDSTGVTDRVVNQLLTQLDGIEGLDGVYLIAASSRPDLIDQALLRPGRIDNFLYLPYPNRNEIFEIYSLYLKGIKLDERVNLQEIAELSTDFSGADIKSVVCDAVLRAFHRIKDVSTDSTEPLNRNSDSESIRESINIEAQDLIQSIQSIRKSISAMERAKLKYMYESWNKKKSPEEESKRPKVPRVTLA